VSAGLVRELGRGAWLTLALMMLLSRAVFQARGAVWMRAFLDAWQGGEVKRAWGAASLAYAALLFVAVAACEGALSAGDDAVIATVLLVLVADGGVNVLPSGFTTFKDRVQRAWIRRRGGPDDRSLFTVGNVLLALGSLGVAAAVLAYRPVVCETVAAAAVAAAVCTAALLGKSGFLLR
jgi:hypothetical protein